MTTNQATDSTKLNDAQRNTVIGLVRTNCGDKVADAVAALLASDGKAGGEAVAWRQITRAGFTRSIREGKPSQEDLEIAAYDGDKIQYFYTRPQQAEQVAQPLTEAERDILDERRRQKEVEGWTTEHDDEHIGGEMALAASCYAAHTASGLSISAYEFTGAGGLAKYTRTQSAIEFVRRMWPWDPAWWKPRSKRRNLVRAGALIVAEIERLDRSAHGIGKDQAS